jgi:hypothetical protein
MPEVSVAVSSRSAYIETGERFMQRNEKLLFPGKAVVY